MCAVEETPGDNVDRAVKAEPWRRDCERKVHWRGATLALFSDGLREHRRQFSLFVSRYNAIAENPLKARHEHSTWEPRGRVGVRCEPCSKRSPFAFGDDTMALLNHSSRSQSQTTRARQSDPS